MGNGYDIIAAYAVAEFVNNGKGPTSGFQTISYVSTRSVKVDCMAKILSLASMQDIVLSIGVKRAWLVDEG